METIETLIPDNKGNHLVIVLYFYDDQEKSQTFHIPPEFLELDIADINIRKLDMEHPMGVHAFFDMCQWLQDQLLLYPNAIFSFICSIDPLTTHHPDITPEQYRWNLFECLYIRNQAKLANLGIKSKEIIVGPEGFQTFARVFYKDKHAPIVHIVEAHLQEKYNL